MEPQHDFRLNFKEDFQRKLFLDVILKETSSQRKLAKLLGVSRGAIKHWSKPDRLLPEYVFNHLIELYPWVKSYYKYVSKKVPINWGQMKGGKIRGKMKSNLTRFERIKGFRKANIVTRKRKVLGPKGERMYNIGEKKIADFLLKNNFDYHYEPVINLGDKYAIPDFLVNNNIIERCGYSNWNVYWSNLIRKFKLFERYEIGKVIVVVPSKHFNFAVKRLQRLNNLIILKEDDIEKMSKILGPRAHNN